MSRPAASAAAALIALAATPVLADEVTIPAAADCLLYENVFGDSGNGGGEFFHTGQTVSDELRRALIRFDVAAALPAGATVESVTMTLFCSRTRASATPVTLHPVLADWGEGDSNPVGNEGSPAQAAIGDATWIFRFYDGTSGAPRWDTPGGDFEPAPSATTVVGGENQYYDWTSTEMAGDVQAWLDDPDSNFGWILIGEEADGSGRTSKRFDSRTNPEVAQRPALTIVYSVDDPCAADIAEPFGVLDLADIQAFIAGFSSGDPIADIAPPAGVFDLADVQAFIAAFVTGCP